MPDEIVMVEAPQAVPAHAAVLNITWDSQNGELPDPVPFDAADADLKEMAAEAISGGSVPGIDAVPDVDLTNYMVRRYDARDNLPNRIVIRPKTPFGI